MKATLSIILTLAVGFQTAHAQSMKKDNVLVEVNGDAITSELLDTPIAASTGLAHAEIGMKYFGSQSESDISVVLTLYGAKSRYTNDESIGAKLLAGDTSLSKNKYRIVDRITKDGEKDYIVLHITTEELAWLAAESKVQIELFNMDTDKKCDSFVLTPSGMNSLKQFAKSVLLIKSHSN